MIVCVSDGLDVSGESVPYITGWLGKLDPAAAVLRYATVIDELAARSSTTCLRCQT